MKIEDCLYFETDDGCAICGIRGAEKLSFHHIDGDKTNNKYDNLIVLCYNCHNQHHQNKGLAEEQIRDRKRRLMLKTLTIHGVSALKMASRNSAGVAAPPALLYHLVGLGLMTKAEELSLYYPEQDGPYVEVDSRFVITAQGAELVRRWFA